MEELQPIVANIEELRLYISNLTDSELEETSSIIDESILTQVEHKLFQLTLEALKKEFGTIDRFDYNYAIQTAIRLTQRAQFLETR